MDQRTTMIVAGLLAALLFFFAPFQALAQRVTPQPLPELPAPVRPVDSITPPPISDRIELPSPTPPSVPAVISASALVPSQWERGTSYQVTIQGSNLVSGLEVRLGKEFQIKNLSIKSASLATMEVTVSSQAALGPHRLELRPGPDHPWIRSQALAVVIPTAVTAPVPTPTPAPPLLPGVEAPPAVTVLNINPNRWYPGESYEVALIGHNFPTNLDLDFGPGIKVEKVTVETPTKATMQVTVAGQALPGVRPLKFQTAIGQPWLPSTTQALVQAPAKKAATIPTIQTPPISELAFAKGVIQLEKPEFGKYLMMENAIGDHGIPVGNDQTRFSWREESPGTSQWFELRVLDHQGKVLLQREIGGLPLPDLFYIPDPEFLVTLFDLVRGEAAVGQAAGTGQGGAISLFQVSWSQVATAMGQQEQAHPLTPGDQYIADNWQEIDCFWEVIGFRRYSTSDPQTGAAVSQVVEVAASERWPLKLPTFSPTGLACDAANTQLTYGKVETGQGGTVSDHAIYVGDRVRVSGQFSLDGNPWGVVYDVEWGDHSPGGIVGTTPVKGWRLRNVFIDWGDGTYDHVYVTPPTATPPAIVGPAGSHSDLKPQGMLSLAMEHVYLYSQKFPVRLFVLPEGDVGMINTIVLAGKMPQAGGTTTHSSQAPPTGPRLATAKPQGIMLAASGMIVSELPLLSSAASLEAVGENLAGPDFFQGFKMPGSRAFLVYCNAQIIDVKADPAATGPLYLLDLKITEFSGQEKPQTGGGLPLPDSQNLGGVLPGLGSTGKTGPEQGAAPQTGTASGAMSGMHFQQTQPSVLEALEMQASPESTISSLTGQMMVQSDATASSCDEAFYAQARLRYYGQGSIVLRWLVDGVLVEERPLTVGPSPIRTAVDAEGTYTDAPLEDSIILTSPPLPLDPAGTKRTLTVEALLGDGERVITRWEMQHQGGVVVQVPIFDQPESVVAPPKTYLVKSPNPGEPCAFQFPVADGKYFVISGLQGRVKVNNGRYSGRGTLFFNLPDGPSGMGRHYVDIDFHNWEVPDGLTVTHGTINSTALNKPLDDLPGLKGVLRGLAGEAGQELRATLDIQVADSGIRLVGMGGAQSPSWNGLTAPLIPDSGWYAAGQTLALTQIGWSLFQIESDDVRIDLSRDQGEPACAGAGRRGFVPSPGTRAGRGEEDATAAANRQWVGVHLGEEARLYPFLFNLADLNVPVANWGIADQGVCGQARFGNFSHDLGAGSIAFDTIEVLAANHQLNANYRNMRIQVPWPAIEVAGGDATLAYAQGQASAEVSFQFDTKGLVAVEDYGPIKMSSQVKSFSRQSWGWGITTDTTFEFRDDQKPFAQALLGDLFFSMDGFAALKHNLSQQTVSLNQSTGFGGAKLELNNLRITPHQNVQAAERLSFKLDGGITMAGLSSATISLFYEIKKPGYLVTASGPTHTPFKVGVAFPPGNPLVETEVLPQLNTPGAMAGAPLLYASLEPMLLAANPGSGAQDSFGGKVSAKLFGMDSPVEATFRYGSFNGKEYWLTHADKVPVNAPIFPGVVLKMVNGGLAYGFDVKVFEGDPLKAIPNQSSNQVYSAGITVVSADQGVFEMSGRLSVSPNDNIYRMRFSPVKLMGIAMADGYFQYGNGVFHGKVWGGFSMFGGTVKVEIPQGNENDLGTVGLYFSKGHWEVYAGRHGGPYVKAHLLILDTYGYLHIGSKVGYAVGGGIVFETPKVCFVEVAAGQLYADALVGIRISPSAHLSADFRASAGLRYWVPCGGRRGTIGRSLRIHVEAPPVKLEACTSIPIPLTRDLNVCFSI